ncbi:hypothetical protein AGMMS50262_02680 [Bacteroidia bacterium]|nr:hypothetical protein AGMMS50262_02680 [Bacteroidia bacterium]
MTIPDEKRYDFGNKVNWTAGAELEYFLPFNRNTTSVIFAPTMEHYKNTKDFYNLPRTLDMVSVTFPIGLRYSFYLNNDMRFFFDASFNPFFYINSNKGFEIVGRTVLEITERANFILGGGFAYKNFQVELKYHTNRELLGNYSSWQSDNSRIALSVSYKLFRQEK